MQAPERSPLGAAILKGAFIEAILLVLGVAIALNTGNYLWVIGFGVAGSVVLLLLMLQARAFKVRDDQR